MHSYTQSQSIFGDTRIFRSLKHMLQSQVLVLRIFEVIEFESVVSSPRHSSFDTSKDRMLNHLRNVFRVQMRRQSMHISLKHNDDRRADSRIEVFSGWLNRLFELCC